MRFPYPGIEENVDQKLKDAIQVVLMKQASAIPEFEQVPVPTEEEMQRMEVLKKMKKETVVKEEDMTDKEMSMESLDEQSNAAPHGEKKESTSPVRTELVKETKARIKLEPGVIAPGMGENASKPEQVDQKIRLMLQW